MIIYNLIFINIAINTTMNTLIDLYRVLQIPEEYYQNDINERYDFITRYGITPNSIIDNHNIFNHRLAKPFKHYNDNTYVTIQFLPNAIRTFNAHMINCGYHDGTFHDIIPQLNNITNCPFKIVTDREDDVTLYFLTKNKNIILINNSFQMNIGLGQTSFSHVVIFYLDHILFKY